MKIITFWGGLGNQIFEYAYYKWLQAKFPNEKIYGYYPKIGLKAHNGLEINKRFNVELPEASIVTNFIGYILFNIARLCRRLRLPLISTCTQINEKYDSIFHCDYWQDKKYELANLKMQFNLCNIDYNNLTLVSKIETQDTIAVHVRRGDYLNPNVTSIYGGICTEDYYKKAIETVALENPNLHYLFFSDDPQYVRNTYHLDNMTIVDWNMGEKSIYDMYLMSKCKYMILANSTFSYWAARLNQNAEKIYCPTRWTNSTPPDIILDSWIKI